MTLFNKEKNIALLKNNASFLLNFFHLGFIQASNALLQIILFPIIIRIVGLQQFGYVIVANSFAILMGTIVNYGTSQSGIKDVALYKDEHDTKSNIFFTILYSRLILFVLSLIVLLIMNFAGVGNFSFFLFAIPIIIAEVINPLFFFIGIEKLFVFNLANLLSKIISIILIIFFVHASPQADKVNFLMGLPTVFFYVLLILFATKKYHIHFRYPRLDNLKKLFQENFSLVFNSVSVHLQQSFFLFTLSYIGNPLVLGAYSLCDKMIGASRMIISSFASAVFPRAVKMFNNDPQIWYQNKKKLNILIAAIFFIVGLIFLLMPGLIISIISGQRNELSETYLRIISLTPLFISLNALNVIELLIKNKYKIILKISFIILLLSIAVSILFAYFNQSNFFAFYPFIIETSCLIIYSFFIKKLRSNN